MIEKHIPWNSTPAVVIVAGCLVAMVNFGVRSSFGLFTAPVSEVHGWPREIFSFAMALQNLLWVMGDAYTVCDPYLFTFASWLEADGVDPKRFPKVLDHRNRMADRPAVKRILALQTT